jgi:hypothetical protein
MNALSGRCTLSSFGQNANLHRIPAIFTITSFCLEFPDVARKVGFEPTSPFGVGFGDRCFQPLSHLRMLPRFQTEDLFRDISAPDVWNLQTVCSTGEIRTHTLTGLSRSPLPIGVQCHRLGFFYASYK